MIETININGEDYVRAADVAGYNETEHVCVIADRGWIFEGMKREDGTLADAHVVRRWENGLGIGALADPEHKDDYVLDSIGDIRIAPMAVIAEFPLGW